MKKLKNRIFVAALAFLCVLLFASALIPYGIRLARAAGTDNLYSAGNTFSATTDRLLCNINNSCKRTEAL